MNKVTSFKKSLQGVRLRELARNKYAWPGGYGLLALMGDNQIVCADCIKENYRLVLDATITGHDREWFFSESFVHWEGDSLQCAHCGRELPPEYSDEV